MEQQTSVIDNAKSVEIACVAADSVNVAYYQNAVPIIRDLAIVNETEADLSEVRAAVQN